MKANRKFKEDGEAVSAVIGVILMVAITVAIAATVYFYVQSLTTTEGGSTPKISYSVSSADDQITITKCTPTDSAYASDATSANLVFKNSTTTVYVKANHAVATTQSSCIMLDIEAGDVITGFADGATYTVVWAPTNEVLGSFSV